MSFGFTAKGLCNSEDKTLNRMFRYFIIILIVPFIAQGQKPINLQVSASSAFNLATGVSSSKNNLGEYSPDLVSFETNKTAKDNLLTDVAVSLFFNAKWNSYLSTELGFHYVGLLDSRTTFTRGAGSAKILVGSSEANYQKLSLDVKLDALFISPYEELNLITGFGYNLLYNRVYSNDVVNDPTSPIYTSNGFTRTMRQLRYFNLNLGLEWRDYITEHFGYFIQLSYNPTIRTNTHSLLFEQVFINGETHPLEGTRIEPGENGLPEENFEFMFVNLSLGLTYQW